MKKSLMILGNLLIVLAILAVVMLYVGNERARMIASKTEAFENMTAAMESVTTNYLVGEQQVCNSWASYIDANDMTAEEAIAFVRDSLSDSDVTAHILLLTEDQGLSGLSTDFRASDAGNYAVTYRNISIFGGSLEEFLRENGTVKVTRAYTNPVNAIQSIAFCCPITVRDAQDGVQRPAVLLRIIPVSAFEHKWAFPTEDYKNAEISLIDGAGEYMRGALALAADFMSRGYVDLDSCSQLKNNYEAVILRFFEGDVPMMMASANTVSGTEKRQRKSEAFTANPFPYSFHPVPSTDKGGYFLNIISIGFGVNKNSKNLDMANEFMRFLVTTEEMNRMAQAKRMVTPCVDMSLDGVYAAFGKLGADRVINQSDLGLADTPDAQVRKAGWQVSNGSITVDEAVAAFGNLN